MAHLINYLISASQLQFQAPALTTVFLVTLFIIGEEQRPYNYPEFNDMVYRVVDESYYHQYQ